MYAGDQNSGADSRPITLTRLAGMKAEGSKIACLTAYDASFASAVDQAGTDLVLVGDSLGMVIQGHQTTVPVSVDDIIYHCRAVARGLRRALLVADMPFMSYSTPEKALVNAGRMMAEGGAAMVKLEGGAIQVEIVRYLSERGIPVCAHIGLTPQFVHKLGGFKVQGKEEAAARQMQEDAQSLQEAGADIVLLECVPSDLGTAITRQLKVPVIGIGAGPETDGQILVLYDILNVTAGRKPRFAKNYLADGRDIAGALTAYVEEVRQGSYPAPEHCF